MPRGPAAAPEASPASYEEFMDRVGALFPTMSAGFQHIARFVIQNPNYVAMNSVNVLAKSCGSHPSSIVRFAQLCGFTGYKQLQAVFQWRLSTTVPGYRERLRALDLDITGADSRNREILRKSAMREMAALQELIEHASETDLAAAAEHMLRAETIFISGQLESEPVAQLLRYLLAKLGRRVVLLDAAGGLSVEMANAMTPRDVLVAISFRYYAKEVVTISGTAYRTQTPTVVITDSPLSPLARNVEVVFVVAQDEPAMAPPLAAALALVQALATILAALLKERPPDGAKLPSRTPWRDD